jgi:23S rRNA pseudouridine1911/1915/1917 synthase
MTSVPAEPADSCPSPESGADHSRLVFPAEAGQRFDGLLAKSPGIASRRMALRLITEGDALLNGRVAPPDRKVRLGDVITYRVPPPQPATAAPEPAPDGAPLPVLYEDADLIVVNKPAGLSMHPGPGHPGGTLVNRMLAHAEGLSGIGGTLRPGIVHRLDKDTTGVLVVAKTDAAHVALAAQFKAHTIHRVYRALVLGHPEAPSGTIDAPLDRHPQHRVKRAVTARGKRAVTHWTVERRLGPLTLLRLQLETGRTHQIRVHLAHLRWPVVGDPLYGNPARVKALLLPEPARALLLAFQRQALHAAELGFTHPTTGQRLDFKAKLPEDFAELVKALGSVEEQR